MTKMSKGGKEHRKRRWVILILFVVLVVSTGLYWFRNVSREVREEKRFHELQKEQDNQDKLSKKLLKENPDMIGWLTIPDTSISYPVMQTIQEPEYYLHRDFDGNYSFYGTPFLDSRCRLQGDNLIIYGHNINGGRFFGALQQYRERSFMEDHQVLFFTTKTAQWKYQIVSVIETDTASRLYAFTDAYNQEDYQKYVTGLLTEAALRTQYGNELLQEVEESKEAHKYQFLTLSTCRTLDGKSARLLVVAARQRSDKWEP